jgi:hypothetical protein
MKKVFSPVLISAEQGDRRLFVSRKPRLRQLELENVVYMHGLNVRHATGPVSLSKGRWKSDSNGPWTGNYALVFSGDFDETYEWYLMALSTMDHDGVIIEPTDIRPPDPRLTGFPAVFAQGEWSAPSLIWKWS